MIVDGSLTAGDTVWSQWANGIQSGGAYQLSFEMTNLDINHTFYNPEFDVTVTDQNGNVALSAFTGDILPQNSQSPPVYVWNPFIYSFSAPSGATSLHVVITQTSGVYLGYDFGLDNISLKGIVCTPTQVEEIQNQPALLVFPNPSSGSFTITIQSNNKSDAVLSIMNALGETVGIRHIHLAPGQNKVGSYEIGIRDLSNGIYFLQLSDGEKIFSNKINVER